jgi:hypothetical protein
MQVDKVETIAADDVVRVRSVEGPVAVEVRLTIDTGDEETTTTLSASQARQLGEALLAHAGGARAARHTISCYLEQANNAAGDMFWVCRDGCQTLRKTEAKP